MVDLFLVGKTLLGLRGVCGCGRGIHHTNAHSWASFVRMSLCGSLRRQASPWCC